MGIEDVRRRIGQARGDHEEYETTANSTWSKAASRGILDALSALTDHVESLDKKVARVFNFDPGSVTGKPTGTLEEVLQADEKSRDAIRDAADNLLNSLKDSNELIRDAARDNLLLAIADHLAPPPSPPENKKVFKVTVKDPPSAMSEETIRRIFTSERRLREDLRETLEVEELDG